MPINYAKHILDSNENFMQFFSEDLSMKTDYWSIVFKNYFDNSEELKKLNCKVGNFIVYRTAQNKRTIFYMICKKTEKDELKYQTVCDIFKSLDKFCHRYNIKNISMMRQFVDTDELVCFRIIEDLIKKILKNVTVKIYK